MVCIDICALKAGYINYIHVYHSDTTVVLLRVKK